MDGHITTAQTNKAHAQQHRTIQKPCRSRTKLTLRIESDILNVCLFRMKDDYTERNGAHQKKQRKNKNPQRSSHLLQFIDKD